MYIKNFVMEAFQGRFHRSIRRLFYGCFHLTAKTMSAYASVGYSRWILTDCHLKNPENPTLIRLKMFHGVSSILDF